MSGKCPHRAGLPRHRLTSDHGKILVVPLQNDDQVAAFIFSDDRVAAVVVVPPLAPMIWAWGAYNPAVAVGVLKVWDVVSRSATDLDVLPATSGTALLLNVGGVCMIADTADSR